MSSSEAPTPTPPAAESSEASGVNLERKARKEAQKALKAQQAAEKKAAKAQAQAQAQAQAASSNASSSSKPKDKHARKPQSGSEQLSRALAYILRHGAEKEGLSIRADGYVRLSDVLDRPRVKSVNMAQAEDGKRRPGVDDVKHIVESNDKKRFELAHEEREWWVRAVQGHSLKHVVELEHIPLTLQNLDLLKPKQPHEQNQEDDALADEMDAKLAELHLAAEAHAVVEVIHGTYSSAWDQIVASGGLKPMTRNHIHLAKGKFGDKRVISGMRKSANRLIYIDIRRAIQDGIRFSLSSNGVVLTAGAEPSGLLSVDYFTRVEDQKGRTVWSPSNA